MSTPAKILSSMVWICVCGAAAAQQTPPPAPPTPKATAQSEAGEPRADTSDAPPAGPAGAPSVASPAAPAPAPAASAPAPTAGRAPATGRAAPVPARTAQPKTDRLELGTATVTGDREQPKVMYIVPWKKSDIGDLTAKPMNSLVDEILAPVDRDVFKREVIYYRAVESTSQNGAPPKPAPQGEK
jgi:cytoskeletal protein RodZ